MSSPILVILSQPQGQRVLSGAITRSIRGRCFGRCPRFRAGARGAVTPFPLQRVFGPLLRGLQHALGNLDILTRQVELVGVELLGARRELFPQQLAEDALQSPLRVHRLLEGGFRLGETRLQRGVLFGEGGVRSL